MCSIINLKNLGHTFAPVLFKIHLILFWHLPWVSLLAPSFFLFVGSFMWIILPFHACVLLICTCIYARGVCKLAFKTVEVSEILIWRTDICGCIYRHSFSATRTSVPRVRNQAPNSACLKHFPEIASRCTNDVYIDSCTHNKSSNTFRKIVKKRTKISLRTFRRVPFLVYVKGIITYC
jgi:hypothetical protein